MQRIVREGKRIRTVHLEVRVVASPLAASDISISGVRVGLIVPRLKHSAVARNRLKRRLRELSRLHLLPTRLRADVVIRIRTAAYAATFDMLVADIGRIVLELRRFTDALNPHAPSDPGPEPSAA